MHLERRARRALRHIQRLCARQSREPALARGLVSLDAQAMGAAQIIRRLEGETELAGRVGLRFSDLASDIAEAAPAHAVAAHGGPFKPIGLAGLEAVAGDGDRRLDGANRRLRHQRAGRRRILDPLLQLGLDRRGQHGRAGRDSEGFREARPVGARVLLGVEIGEGEFAVDEGDVVQPRRTRRGDREFCSTLRRHRRDPAGEGVVVGECPAVLQLAPADPLHGDLDGRAQRTAFGRYLDAHVDVEIRLGIEPFALLQDHVMAEAEIVGRGELGGELAGGVGAQARDEIGEGLIGAAVVFPGGRLPFPAHGAPDQIHLLIGGQSAGLDAHGGSSLPMTGQDRHAPHIAADGLRQRRLGPELRGASGERAADLETPGEGERQRDSGHGAISRQ